MSNTKNTKVLSHLMIAVIAQAHGRSKLAAHHLAHAALDPQLDEQLDDLHDYAEGEQEQAAADDQQGDDDDDDQQEEEAGFEEQDPTEDAEQAAAEVGDGTEDEFDRMEDEIDQAEPMTNMRGGDNQEAARARRVTSNLLAARGRNAKVVTTRRRQR